MESLPPTPGPQGNSIHDDLMMADPHSPPKTKSSLPRPSKKARSHAKTKNKPRTLPADTRDNGGSQATLLGQDSLPDFYHTAPPSPRVDEQRSTHFSQPLLPLPSSSSTLCNEQESDIVNRFEPPSSTYWEELASATPLPTTETTTITSRPSTPLATPPATSPVLSALDLGDTSIDSRFFSDGDFSADPNSDSISQFIHCASQNDGDNILLDLHRALSPQPALVSPPSSSPPPSMFQSELSFALGANPSPSVASTASRAAALGGGHSPYVPQAMDSRPSAPSTPNLNRRNSSSLQCLEPSTAILIRNFERLVRSVWPDLDRDACMQPQVVDEKIQQRRDENHEITAMLAEMDLFDTEMFNLRSTLTQKESLLAYLGTITGAAHAPLTAADVDRAVDRGRAPDQASLSSGSPAPTTPATAPDWHTYMQVRSDLTSATATIARLETQLADAHAQVQEYMDKLVDQRSVAHAHYRDLEAERAERARDQAEHADTVQRIIEREQAAYARADEWERAACEAAGLVGELRARVSEVEAEREAAVKDKERVESKWREASEEATRWRREGKETRQAIDEALKAGKVKGVDGAHGKSKDTVSLAEYVRNAFTAVTSKALADKDEALGKMEKRMRQVEEERDAMERDLMDCAGLISGHEDKLASFERESQRLREEVGRLEWQLQECREKDEAAKRQVEEQAKEVERLRRELEAEKKELDEVRAKLDNVTSERDGAGADLAEVRAKLKSALASQERIAAELEQAAMEREATHAKLNTKHAELESTQSQHASTCQQLALVTNDLATAQAANAALDSTAQRQKKEIKKLSQRIRDLEKQVTTITAQTTEASKSLKVAQDSLEVEAALRKDAERERDAQCASVKDLRNKYAAKLTECDSLAQQLKETQAQAVDLQTQLDQFTIQMDALKSQQVTSEAHVQELTLERSRLAADLAEKQTELHRSRLGCEDLAQQLRMVESQAAAATARVLAIQADNDNLVSNASKLTTSITELQNTLDAAVTARTRADAELDRARKEIAGLQATVQEYEHLGDHVGVAAASAGSAMRELDSARRRIGDLEQEAEGLRSQVRELESVLRTWTAERDSSYRVTGALRAQVAFWRERAEGRGAGAASAVPGALGSGSLIGSSTSSSASSDGSSGAGAVGAALTATSAARRLGRLFS